MSFPSARKAKRNGELPIPILIGNRYDKCLRCKRYKMGELETLSLCEQCNCMTKTVYINGVGGFCGKCKQEKKG